MKADAEAVERWVREFPPLTQKEIDRTTEALKSRHKEVLGYSLPVLWPVTPEQALILTYFGRRYRFAVSRLPQPKDLTKYEQELNEAFRQNKEIDAEGLQPFEALTCPLLACSYELEPRAGSLFKKLTSFLCVDRLESPPSGVAWEYIPEQSRIERPELSAALYIGMAPFYVIALMRPRSISYTRGFSGALFLFHNETGPAFVTALGQSLYYLWGQPVPRNLIEAPNQLTTQELLQVLAIRNVDIRTFALRRIDLAKYFHLLRPEVLDEWRDYKLLRFSPPAGIRRMAHCLEMVNPTTGAVHYEWVPRRCISVQAALNFRNRGRGFPVVLT